MALAIERLYRLTVDANQAVRELQKLNKTTASMATGFSNIQGAIGLATRALTAFGSLSVLKGIVDTANQVNLLEASFGALTGSAERGAGLLAGSFKLVEQTGAGFDDVVTSVQRLTIGMNELGATNTDIEGVAEAFIKIGRIGGTSMFSTNQALVQFTQGLASGKLQGDELRSILERVPLITSLIADEMGRTRGEIKELGKQGKITADIMVSALLNALPQIRKDFETLPTISEQAINKIAAQWIQLQRDLSEESGLGEAFVEGLELLADALRESRPDTVAFVKALRDAIRFGELAGEIMLGLAAAIGTTLVIAYKRALFAQNAFIRGASRFLGFWGTLAAAAIYVITNWNEVSLLFQYKLPIILDKALILGYKFQIGVIRILESIGGVANLVVNTAIETINGLIRGIDMSPLASMLNINLSGFQLAMVDSAEGIAAVNAKIAEIKDNIHEVRARIRSGEVELEAELKALEERLNKVSESAEDAVLNMRDIRVTAMYKGDYGSIDQLSEAFEKLRQRLDPTYKAMQDYDNGLALLLTAQTRLKDEIDPAVFDQLIAALKNVRDEALLAQDAVMKMTDIEVTAEYKGEYGPIEKFTEAFERLREKLDSVYEGTQEYQTGLDFIAQAQDRLKGKVDPAVFDQMREALTKMYEEMLNANDPTRQLQARISALMDSVDPKRLPIREFAQQMVDLQKALALGPENGGIDPTTYERLAIALAKLRDEAIKGAGEDTKSLLEQIKTAVEGFAKDFTNTIVDAVRKGSLSFKDFADEVLSTILKLMLNKIFTQFFDMIASGLVNSFSPASASGGGTTRSGLVALASPDTVTTYGRSTPFTTGGIGRLYDAMPAQQRIGSEVNVTVNNNAPVEVNVEQKKSQRGMDIDIYIEQKVASALSNGGLDRTMRSNYGIMRRAF